MNKVELLGRMTKDIELKKGKNDNIYGVFTLAIPRKENKEMTDFIDCIAFGKLAEALQKYTEKVFKFLNCKDLTRIDFFYDEENNKIYINEINTLPGFTEISMYPKLIMDKKISYTNLITYLLQK